MKRLKSICPVILLILFLFTSMSIGAEPGKIEYVLPEVITHVELSNSDVNRIVCPSEIRDIIVSKE